MPNSSLLLLALSAEHTLLGQPGVQQLGFYSDLVLQPADLQPSQEGCEFCYQISQLHPNVSRCQDPQEMLLTDWMRVTEFSGESSLRRAQQEDFLGCFCQEPGFPTSLAVRVPQARYLNSKPNKHVFIYLGLTNPL